ncbi:putative thioesterase, Acyl transferase domain superfamily, phosphopantetheine binding ACP [Septoria linicola]|nr:putative thioesterase, Acyl transferase domain superfamily, phosphopantetheine binding ACP [Septoria linicola]
MGKISIFAGLGSDVLFSKATRDQALRDCRSPHGKVLIEGCHEVFVEEVTRASKDTTCDPKINLDDFKTTRDLVEPCHRYHGNPIVQNASLVIVQALRYLALEQHTRDSGSRNVAVGAFCTGLLTAVAVATSTDSLQFLARAKQCFRAAVLIGLSSWRMRQKVTTVPSDLPWSLLVTNIGEQEMSSIISNYESKEARSPVFVSAVNSASCVTLSGSGKSLRRFVESALPTRCSIRPTHLRSLYHSPEHGPAEVAHLLKTFEAQETSFPMLRDLNVPLLSTIDGSLITCDRSHENGDLLARILEMILATPTNWMAVQDAALSCAREIVNEQNDSANAIWNFGPGYGALTGHQYADCDIDVRDVSQWRDSDNTDNDDIAIIPKDRFHIEDYYTGGDSKPLNSSRSMATKYGNFVDDPFSFDAALFGISPREASSIDPQQRLMLQTVYRALEHAGYVPDSTPSFSRETFGCFVGSATLDYVDNLKGNIDVYYSPGTLRAFISGRVSYAFKWSGPSITVDTACSSSLTALYQAARAIAAGDCRAAIAGGVNVITSPDMYLGLDKAHFLSPSGQCKAFDESADGYCRSEGCASFVLKRLSDALAENDRVLGVIKGIAVNQSGSTSSITHPHAPTQERLFDSLLKNSDVAPHDVTVVEAHGTGTQAGDPNELRSIRGVFAQQRPSDNKLHVTSLKSNIGHLEAASGGAALAKLLLMLRHQRIPPQVLLRNLNPAIDELGVDGTCIGNKAVDWKTINSKKRIALLNNFGAAGSNGALLLQEHIDDRSLDNTQQEPETMVFGCSAMSAELLEQARESLVLFLKDQVPDIRLSDICYTSTSRRSLGDHRLSVTAKSIAGLAAALEKAKDSTVPDSPRPIVFLFSGQGSQYAGMGKGLLDLLPVFKSIVLQCDQLLVGWGYPGCLNVIQADSTEGFDTKNSENIQSLQCGVFVLEVALAGALVQLGVKPTLVAGHSLGELAALVTAGVLDIESGLWLVAERARLIVEKCDLFESSMLAINMAATQARQEILSLEQFGSLTISCENSPGDCVIGGSIAELERLENYISEDKDYKATRLDVPVGYHTAALDPVLKPLALAADNLSFSAPKISTASNVLGRVIEVGEEGIFHRDYVAHHCKGPVAFNSSIIDAYEQDEDLTHARWIEIGPHPMLLPMIAQHGAGERSATLRKNKPADQTIAELFSSLYQDHDGTIAWRELYEKLPCRPRLVDLPESPMDKKRYLIPLKRESAQAGDEIAESKTTLFTLLKSRIETDDEAEAVFETPIHELSSMIKGHIVCGAALCPASIYTEMALAAITLYTGEDKAEQTAFKISAIRFLRPLLYVEGANDVVRITLRRQDQDKSDTSFEVSSFATPASDAKIHCFGTIKEQPHSKAGSKLRATEQALSRRKTMFQTGDHQTFSTRIMYDKIFSRVVEYSSTYQAVKKIYMDDRLEEIFAACTLPASEHRYAGQPILLDTMLHVAGFAANLNVDNETVCICHHVHSTMILRKEFRPGQAFDVHCSNFVNPEDADCILAEAHAVDDEGIIAVIKGMEFRKTKLAKLQQAFDFASRPPSQINSKPVSASRSPVRRSEQPVAQEPEAATSRRTSSTPGTSSPGTSRSTVTSQDTVITILSDATGLEPDKITPRTTLAAMGVDSIMMFELDRKLEEAMGQKPSVAELSACKTVGDMETLVSKSASRGATPVATQRKSSPRSRNSSKPESLAGPEKPRKTSEPLPLSDTNSKTSPEDNLSTSMIELLQRRLGSIQGPQQIQRGDEPSLASPIYLIHPGAGICLHYNRLSSLGRDVYTIQDGRLLVDRNDDWKSVEDVAENYSKMVSEHSVDAQYAGIILAGWSFGGIIAFEAARRILSLGGIQVLGVVLIDPPPPMNHQPIAQETIEVAMAATLKASRPRSREVADFEAAIAALTIRNNLRRAALLGKYRPSIEVPMPRITLLRSVEGLDLGVKDLPENEWLHDRSDKSVCTGTWEDLMRHPIDVLDIPGDHFTPFEADNIEGTASAIREACKNLEVG